MRFSGAKRPASQMEVFRDIVQECNFHELAWDGPMYTWYRGDDENMIGERLDRGFGSSC